MRKDGACIGCGYRICQCLELHLERDLKAVGIWDFEREFVFAPGRKFRADFAWPEKRLLVEVEGGTWTNGRHSRGSGFEIDCEKYNLAARLGFCVLRYTARMVKNGLAVAEIELALASRKAPESRQTRGRGNEGTTALVRG